MKKMRVLSGMQPSGRMHLGNLIGALQNWIKLQDENECFFFVADWHAISTNYENTKDIKENVKQMLIDWLACGLDPVKSTLFIQSKVEEHAILHLLLSMITPVSWLERNPTYKEQQEQIKNRDLSTYGFLGYPVLQSADILIYKADAVPVGVDQLPHLELTREIARRFNYLYANKRSGERSSAWSTDIKESVAWSSGILIEPKALLTEIPKLPGTDGRKMSKSYNNAIYLSDPVDVFENKVKNLITDPARVRRTDKGNPDVCTVFVFHKIYSSADDISQIDRDCRSAAIGCTDCKKRLLERMKLAMKPIWEKREALLSDPKKVFDIAEQGSIKAKRIASETLIMIKEAMRI
ncbi:MAG: tryptophan--tRNA ligase [Nitrospirota bacterium]